ncbi:hypothetical protein ACP70R_037063 [Stipagrostis hirtigluma subsp. patula]
MDRLPRRHEELTGGRAGATAAGSRRGRFYDHHDGHGGDAPATVPVVDQAECTARSCRSCVAVTLADVIALGCCPCAVVSLLGLAFVKAPLAVARRCLRRLRRRRGELRHKKRVRDLDAATARGKCRAGGAGGCRWEVEAGAAGAWRGQEGLEADEVATRASSSSSGRLDAEKVWMEMYRYGHWGFGRLSISVTPPPAVRAGCVAAGRRSGDGDGGRKDTDLRCVS